MSKKLFLMVTIILSTLSQSYALDFEGVCRGEFNGDELHFSIIRDRTLSYQIFGKVYGYRETDHTQSVIYQFDGWGNNNKQFPSSEFDIDVFGSDFSKLGSGKIEFWKNSRLCGSIRAGCYPHERRVIPGKTAKLTIGEEVIYFYCEK